MQMDYVGGLNRTPGKYLETYSRARVWRSSTSCSTTISGDGASDVDIMGGGGGGGARCSVEIRA